MSKNNSGPWLGTITVLGGLLFPSVGLGASDFYHNKVISFYIGFGAGGGYDSYSRLVARHLGRHINGNPSIVAKNMPGAGGLKVASYMWQLAAKDGTSLAMASEALVLERILESAAADYEADQFNWIGRLSAVSSVFYTWHTSSVKNIVEARQRESIFGSSGAGITYYTPRALNELAGTKFRVIAGYKGSAEVELALERGEVDGGFGFWWDLERRRPEWITSNKVNPLFVVSSERLSELPNVPTTIELAKDSDGREIMRLFASTSAVGRSVFTTAGVPNERVVLLRDAFHTMLADPAFLEDVKKVRLPLVEPINGEELQKVIQDTFTFPKALVEEAKRIRG